MKPFAVQMGFPQSSTQEPGTRFLLGAGVSLLTVCLLSLFCEIWGEALGCDMHRGCGRSAAEGGGGVREVS